MRISLFLVTAALSLSVSACGYASFTANGTAADVQDQTEVEQNQDNDDSGAQTPASPMTLTTAALSPSDTITIDTAGRLNVDVDWGDGSDGCAVTFTASEVTSETELSCEYSTGGVKTITISPADGAESGPYLEMFGALNNARAGLVTFDPNIVSIESFGNLGTTSMIAAFRMAPNLQRLPDALPATVTNLAYAFQYAKSVPEDIASWNTRQVTNMAQLFAETGYEADATPPYASTFNVDISSWDVRNVTNMAQMFSNANAFNQDISGWVVNPAAVVTGMFNGATNFAPEVTLTFDSAGGSSVNSVTDTFDAALTVAPPNRDGFTFDGWTPELPENVPAFDTTYTATWAPFNGTQAGISWVPVRGVKEDGTSDFRVNAVATDGAGTFVAVGESYGTATNLTYSTDDGITWTDSNDQLDDSTNINERITAKDIAYGNGVWVAVGKNSGSSNGAWATSTDGANWTITQQGSVGIWSAVATDGAGTWMAVSENSNGGNLGSNCLMVSVDDGASWQTTQCTSDFSSGLKGGNYTSVAYGQHGEDDIWVVAGENGLARSSDNGATWTVVDPSPFEGDGTTGRYVAYGDGVWLAIEGGDATDNTFVKSVDGGVTWTTAGVQQPADVAASIATDWRALAYGDGVWIAMADETSDNSPSGKILKSTDDGASWQVLTRASGNITDAVSNLAFGQTTYSIAYGQDVFVAVAGNHILRSDE